MVALGLMGANASVKSKVEYASTVTGVPIGIAKALISKESGWDPKAIHYNFDGSVDRGLMQINSSSESSFSLRYLDGQELDPFDVDQSIAVGLSFLADMHERFGSWITAVMAYNCGPGTVENEMVPETTKKYAREIMGEFKTPNKVEVFGVTTVVPQTGTEYLWYTPSQNFGALPKSFEMLSETHQVKIRMIAMPSRSGAMILRKIAIQDEMLDGFFTKMEREMNGYRETIAVARSESRRPLTIRERLKVFVTGKLPERFERAYFADQNSRYF